MWYDSTGTPRGDYEEGYDSTYTLRSPQDYGYDKQGDYTQDWSESFNEDYSGSK